MSPEDDVMIVRTALAVGLCAAVFYLMYGCAGPVYETDKMRVHCTTVCWDQTEVEFVEAVMFKDVEIDGKLDLFVEPDPYPCRVAVRLPDGSKGAKTAVCHGGTAHVAVSGTDRSKLVGRLHVVYRPCVADSALAHELRHFRGQAIYDDRDSFHENEDLRHRERVTNEWFRALYCEEVLP